MPKRRHQRRTCDDGASGLPRRAADGPVRRLHHAGTSNLPAQALDQAIAFWQPRSSRTLTREDAREIVQNLTGFFGILNEWRRAERAATSSADAADDEVKRGRPRRNAAPKMSLDK